MLTRSRCLGWFVALAALGCSETTVEVELHSLQSSGEAAFVCRRADGRGIDRSQCPDFENGDPNAIFALVTQTSTEEVAVINTRAAAVVDLDPSIPGYSFLRVPSRPGDIASSPGGAATFVGITGVGKTGITALPTTCIGAPGKDETARDVTSFASCHLPSTPGDIVVIVAPPESDGTIRESCAAGSPAETQSPLGASFDEGGDRTECAANVTLEHLDAEGNVVGPVGRRKLAVALPFEEIPQIAIIDAQWLLDRTPGSFEECRIEATVPLDVDLGPPGTQQLLDEAPELVARGSCAIDQPVTPPTPPSYTPRPAGFALADDVLYVADQRAPVVHVIDVSDPCAPNELPPLLPMSFDRPSRVVTTSRVAASPLTPAGKRFVYAVDEFDQPAASIMAFDVSPGSTNRTPLVRPGSLRVPEPPDRLQLTADVADVAFAYRDLPAADPVTGVAGTGVHCDPNPFLAQDSPPAQHRPTSDRTRGAQPRLLRGLFGLAMLSSGQVAIIDVDDFDAPCRRPIGTNAAPDDEDFRGCKGDVGLPPYLTLPDGTDPQGASTVTNEVSCNMVKPHRYRSALLGVTSSSLGAGAPSLVAFPVFTRPTDVNLPPQHQPKLLAVPFEGASPDQTQVYIGTTLHAKGSASADLPTDPNTSALPSLTLPFAEPRAIPASDRVNVVYEAMITDAFPSGRIVVETNADGQPEMHVVDATAEYCDRGVYDLEMLAALGFDRFEMDVQAQNDFADAHADVAVVTSELLPVEDSYWVSSTLLTAIADGGVCELSRNACDETFGNYDPEDVNPNRELRILRAYQDRLVVEPQDPENRDELRKRFDCCFPQGVEHRVRVQKQWIIGGNRSGLRHDVTARRELDENGDATGRFRCHRSCNPKTTYHQSRVFEIATRVDCAHVPGTPGCAVGLAELGDPCAYDACEPERDAGGAIVRCTRGDGRGDGSIDLDEPASACIHSGLTARFAIYRGLTPSVRGMRFSWETTGGFRTLLTSIAAVSAAVIPQQVQYLPELQRIAIVDGASLGLTLVSLDSLRVEQPWPVY